MKEVKGSEEVKERRFGGCADCGATVLRPHGEMSTYSFGQDAWMKSFVAKGTPEG